MPSHEAGWAHADGALKGPSWLRQPNDPNSLVPSLWSSTAHKVDGDLTIGGVAVAEHTSSESPSSASHRATVVQRKALPA